jgi:hypothetical protein
MKKYFSERYNFQVRKIKKMDEIDENFKNRIWNLFRELLYELLYDNKKLLENVYDKFLKGKIEELWFVISGSGIDGVVSHIMEKLFNQKWYKIYDFLEFLMEELEEMGELTIRDQVAKKVNKIFEEENIGCRIIDNLVVPIIDEEEIKEIETAQKISDRYSGIKIHLQKAVELYSKRPQPDYKNSIKESISAIEALARIITNNPSADLGDLTKQLPLHRAFRNALDKLYAWTSDEGGIRHSQKDYKDYLESGENEARFMLVLASAFVNYIISKYENTK